MSIKHTPGRWVIDWNVSRLDVFSSDSSTLIATLRRSALSPAIDDAAKANARLIAAAPDLLNALVSLEPLLEAVTIGLGRVWVEADGSETDFGAALDLARAAIAKATEGQA